MDVERISAADRLRIAVLGDFEGVHTRAWLRWFIDRGHDMHAISYYRPRVAIEGVTMHALSERSAASAQPGALRGFGRRSRMPRGLFRLLHAVRYRRAGLARLLRDIDPDVFHAHFLVEHGFYGAAAGFHPFVVTAWGSDVLVEPDRDRISRRITTWTVGRADAVTSNSAYMADRIAALGAPREKVHLITLGADRYDLGRADQSVNLAPAREGQRVISTRAHEALYNIDDIIDAFADLARGRPDVRLTVAHHGSLTPSLRQRAVNAGAAVEFTGVLDRSSFRDALAGAEVFVSVPSSDATSVALLQAMAAGCFPVVSALPTTSEWIADGDNGLMVERHDRRMLAEAIERALDDHELRRRAAGINRRIVEERGLNELNMPRLERLYLDLARRPSR